MKKITLLILTLCLASVASAEPVGKQAALYTAQSYMLAKGKIVDENPYPSQTSRRKVSGQSSSEETEGGQPYYYVFNVGDDNGYVIVSGDDRVEPILGYVEQGSFDPDNIPENMSSWLQFYADQIKYIVDNDIEPDSPILKKRNKVHGIKHSVAEMLTTRWNQGSPYNILCPKYYKGDGTRAYPATGCSATAMAQVVNYYKFPEKTKEAIPALNNTYTLDNGTKKSVTAKLIPRNTVIDWDNMLDTYSWQDEEHANAQDTAVAQLMLMCGQGVKMSWGASSGAVTSRARDFFVNVFGYDNRAYWASPGDYGIDEWFDLLYNEIDAGYPVLYAGHSSGGGHAFVLDGFDGDNLFHVNWGWGGGSNGWFLVTVLNPGDSSGIGASSSSDGYSMSQGALFNLRIPGTPKGDAFLHISDVSIVNKTSVKATFTNTAGFSGGFHSGVVMLCEDGSLALVGNKLTISSLASGASQTKTFALRNKLSEGTYKLSPACKPMRSEEWQAKYDFRSQYIEAVVDSTGAFDLQFITPTYEEIYIDTITCPGTRIVGKQQEVKVTFRNVGAEFYDTVYLLASKTNKKVYTESKSKVALHSGETMDISFFFTPEETGTYNLWLCLDEKGDYVIGEGTVEVIEEADAVLANLAVSSYNISNAINNIAYGKRFIGKATIRNNAKTDFHGSIRLQLWNQKVGSSTAYSGPSRSYSLDINAGKTATIEFDFDNLNAGYYYRFKVLYGSQDGTLSNGGLWDNKWEMAAGLLKWSNDGTVAGQAYSPSITAAVTVCGIYADCNKISRLKPNTNPNTIYAFASGMQIPNSLAGYNAVAGNHAERIDLVKDKPYYIPLSFDADSASFTYTFPETEDGTRWYAFTMPFRADSLFLDSIPVMLDDTLKHFWIYEFAAEGNNGDVIFAPAKELRGGTPYIIAGDAMMAGRSLVFRSLDVPFYKTGSDKMLVTSPSFKFHGNTLTPITKECYILNEEGTAFEYVTTNKKLGPLVPYFTTNLPEELRLPSIVLPEIPVAPTPVGDLNGDSQVDIADAVSVLNLMAVEGYNKIADINNDGIIDIADFVSILNLMAGD